MLVKQVKVFVKRGHLAEYLAAQDIWNCETAGAPGYEGSFCGRCPQEPDVVHLLLYWRSREDLDRWMQDEHDRIAGLAQAYDHYDRLEVRTLEELERPA